MFRTIECYKCSKCGRVLTSIKGLERHKKTCKGRERELENQISFDEIEKEKIDENT